MRELNKKESIEISVKKQQQKETEFIDRLIPHNNHKIWEVNTKTKEIDLAKYSNATYQFAGDNKKEIIVNKDCVYICALNKKNALKKFEKGVNGSKEIISNPISLYVVSFD